MPKTSSTSQIQKNYRTVFDDVIKSREPIVVMNNNNPEVVILDITSYQDLLDAQKAYELEIAKSAIKEYKKEKKRGALKKLNSLEDLI